MFDLILQILSGSFTVLDLARNLFWPLVSIPDLVKISGLLIGAAIVQLWVRNCRNRRPADDDASRRDA